MDNGNLGINLVYTYAGNPTGVSTQGFNPPIGSIVIDTVNFAIWQKSSTDNATYSGVVGSTLTLPLIAGGLTASGSVANDFSGSTGAFKTSTGINTFGGSVNNFTNALTMATATKGLVLKQGANGLCGTFVANGATPVTVSSTAIAITDAIIISLNTIGGTVGVQPHVATITAATSFTIVATASDTSTYNWAIIKNAA